MILTSGFLLHFVAILSYTAPHCQNVCPVLLWFEIDRSRACSGGFCGENQTAMRKINGKCVYRNVYKVLSQRQNVDKPLDKIWEPWTVFPHPVSLDSSGAGDFWCELLCRRKNALISSVSRFPTRSVLITLSSWMRGFAGTGTQTVSLVPTSPTSFWLI